MPGCESKGMNYTSARICPWDTSPIGGVKMQHALAPVNEAAHNPAPVDHTMTCKKSFTIDPVDLSLQ